MALTKRKVGTFLVVVLFLAGGGFVYLRLRPRAFAAEFPSGLHAEFLVRLDDPKAARPTRPVHFNVDRDGRPFLLVGRTFIAVQHSETSVSEALPLPDGEPISDFAWMTDGTLLVIEGKTMSAVTGNGLKLVQTLPQPDMKLAPASVDRCYLFGGRDPEQQRKLYLYKRGGDVLQLLQTESPIAAVAGDGENTFVAIDRAIYLMMPGSPLTQVYRAQDPIISLAIGPEFTLFFSTASDVGFSNGTGNAQLFVHGRGAEIQVRDETLYLYFPGVGIMQCSPVGVFLGASGKAGSTPARETSRRTEEKAEPRQPVESDVVVVKRKEEASPRPAEPAPKPKFAPVLDFAGLDTSSGSATGAPLEQYLERCGVHVTAVTPGTDMLVLGAQPSIVPRGSSKVLTQAGSTKPVSFTLTLTTPAASVRFTRPKLVALTSNGVTHPQWKATALDAQGNELDSAREDLIASYQNVPAATFELKGPGVTSIRFDSDCREFAGSSAVLLSDIEIR